MLCLKELDPFAIGGTRRCYVHPLEPDKCVKVLRSDRTPHMRRTRTRGWRRLRRLRHFDDQWKEQRGYAQVSSAQQKTVWQHVPEYFGAVETDMGVGIVTRLHRDFDNRYPMNLEQLLPLGMTTGLQTAINEFMAWLRRDRFLTRGLLPHNIIAVRLDETRYRLMIVDGIGNSEFIPISTWFRTAAQRKIERKIRRFERRIQDLLP